MPVYSTMPQSGGPPANAGKLDTAPQAVKPYQPVDIVENYNGQLKRRAFFPRAKIEV
jgi:hypothetical protein